jgi:ferredoxin-nitrite reductase
VLFNVVVGGYFSLKRNMMSLPLGIAVTPEQLIPFTLAVLRVFRWGCCVCARARVKVCVC